MFRILVCTLLVLPVAASPAFAKEWARKMFEETRHDFGTVARGAKAEFRFKLKNIYKEDVHISGVRSSCGCTSPTIDGDLLKTYDEGAILATFNTRSFYGQKNATVTVTFDQPFDAEVQLQVSGYIRTDLTLEPGGAEFGTIDAGTASSKRLRISHDGAGAWAITSIKSGSRYVEAEAVETSRTSNRVTYDLTVFVRPEAPPGYVKEQLIIGTNDRQTPEFPVSVEARVVSELTVSPASLFLGALKPGQKVKKQVVVHGKKPFRITGVSCDDDCFQFGEPSQAAKPFHLVPIIFTAGDTPGKLSYKIKIQTDLGHNVVSELSAFAQVLDVGREETSEDNLTARESNHDVSRPIFDEGTSESP